jgi:dual-specificity kinase
MEQKLVSHSTASSSENVLYEFKPEEVFNERFTAIKVLGEGTFGRVLSVYDRETDTIRAMKIVMPVSNHIVDAKVEAMILTNIGKAPEANRTRIVQLISTFMHNDCY